MNVASKELCEELYAVSGWRNTEKLWLIAANNPQGTVWRNDGQLEVDGAGCFPAYDLGYLLRKLPPFVWSEQYEQKAWLWLRKNTADYNAWYWVNDPKYGEDQISEHGATETTPEDAACKLAIQLFKTNILKREVQHGY